MHFEPTQRQEQQRVEHVAHAMQSEARDAARPPGEPLRHLVVIEGVERAHRDLNGDQRPKQWRGHDAASLEHGRLTHQQAEPRMDDVQREAEGAAAEIGMGDRQRTGRQTVGQRQAKLAELHEIARAA